MIKKILIQQKEELNGLLNRRYIERISEPAKAEYLATGLIKLISGPRRAGKSVLALQLLRDQNFAYLNFDDDLLLKNFGEDAVTGGLHELYPGFQFLLLDEIQNLPQWELWVNKLYRRGINLVVTGSNAKLLSHEMASSLTGRFIQLTLLPFSFAEYLEYQNIVIPDQLSETARENGIVLSHMNTWLQNGGFPEIVMNPAVLKNYLSSLFDSILLKDLVHRFRIRQIREFYDLANYLLANYTNLWSFNQLASDLDFKSVATVQKFVGYLSEPFLFLTLTRYSTKVRQQQKAPRKSYIIDQGFIQARSFELSPNYGRILENVVFIELLRRNFNPETELFYFKSGKGREIDFVCRKGHRIDQLIQVCYDLTSPKTFNRETDALLEASLELDCANLLVITWNRDEWIEKGGRKIRLVPAYRWLTAPS
jgi:predicted AAA+ superfamily ATPase